jgi:anti-sigma regulatory factor (Ser/Thr protein kinase)/anti-anti-sigma regulatory factor
MDIWNEQFICKYRLDGTLKEDDVWRDDIYPYLKNLPKNVIDFWAYGFSEMFNNVIDHSEGTVVEVNIEKKNNQTIIVIQDNGVGIFKKIQQAFNLRYEYEAILELSKGKLTTDSKRHSGEGIFFTSRSFDEFKIKSGDVDFVHYEKHNKDFIFGKDYIQDTIKGTAVILGLSDNGERLLCDVFDKFTTDRDNGFVFDKTIIPVRLAQFGDEFLVSRSQAKRLLMRFDSFRSVVLDFAGVDKIGQSFADEIFRVFQNVHPHIEIIEINVNEQIKKMINWVRRS